MYAFPVERTPIQSEPVVPPRRSVVGEAARSAALEARDEQKQRTDRDPLTQDGTTTAQTEAPVPSEGKGTLVDLIL